MMVVVMVVVMIVVGLMVTLSGVRGSEVIMTRGQLAGGGMLAMGEVGRIRGGHLGRSDHHSAVVRLVGRITKIGVLSEVVFLEGERCTSASPR